MGKQGAMMSEGAVRTAGRSGASHERIGEFREMTHISDDELMKLIRERRREALEEVYDRYAKLVYSFAYRCTKDDADAAEIVQTVFSRIWTSAASYRPEKGRFSSWLLTITRNIAIDLLRRKRRQPVAVPLDDAMADRLADDRVPTPEQAAMRASDREKIRAAYRHLSDAQRRLIELFYWQGYALSEIAELNGEPVGTVKSRLHQALLIFRKHLGGEREDS